MSNEKKSEWLLENIKRLLKQVGREGKCKGCDREIWWVEHNSGKAAPYTNEALNHFADCPDAQRFRNGK